MKFITVQNYDQMSRTAANIISAQVIMKPQSVLGLATGSSPLGTYRQLIEWYKKGGILNDPTIFGFNPFSGKAMVGGEAGAEAIAPIDTLKKYVTEAVNDAGSASLLREIVNILNEFKRSGMPISIDITTELDGAAVARKLYKYNLLEQRNHGTSLINA